MNPRNETDLANRPVCRKLALIRHDGKDSKPGERTMSVWGEKCVRCGGKRTRSTYEGLPTCDDCQKLLEAQLQADAEDHRLCPLDGVAMSKEIVLNVVVDRCPACKGMWLDGGELELL
ncbi:MAG: zf-TFIIB domain-containing protein, partial [Gemmatimonadota bacterium]